MADDVVAPVMDLARGRAKAFGATKIPQVISITYPAFTTIAGDKHVERAINISTVPIRKRVVTMELTAEHLEWFAAAASREHVATAQPKRNPRDDEDLPELAEDACNWGRRKNNAAIYCRYRTTSGQWQTHAEMPAYSEDADLQQRLLAETERRVQHFYERNHVPDTGAASSAQAPITDAEFLDSMDVPAVEAATGA
jgi:hypothetical protein